MKTKFYELKSGDEFFDPFSGEDFRKISGCLAEHLLTGEVDVFDGLDPISLIKEY